MKELGYSENQAKIAFFNTNTHLTATELVATRMAKQFEIIMAHFDTDNPAAFEETAFAQIVADYYAGCFKIGYTKTEADKLYYANRLMPTASDIDEMSAKEAFEREFYTLFKMNTELPEEYKQMLKSLNVPESEILKRWIKHWNHPALGQMMEMWIRFGSHRTDKNTDILTEIGADTEALNFTTEILGKAFKLQEQSPYWEDLFKAIGFRNLNQTQLQGGYVYGLKSDSWFKGRLRDTGLCEEDAEFQLDVWRRKYPYSSKAPLSESIYKKLLRGDISHAKATELFKEQNVPDNTIGFYLKQATEHKLMKQEQMIIRSLKKVNQQQVKTAEELKALITNANIDDSRKDFIIDVVKSGDYGNFRRLSPRDISRGLNSGTIEPTEARAYLTSLRLLDDDINAIVEIYQSTQAPDN